MTMPSAVGSVGWIQVGSDDPEGAKRFYGELFGWNFVPDKEIPGYQLLSFPGDAGPSGGVMDTSGSGGPNHAIFLVVVADVPASVATAERLGAKVQLPPTSTPTGLVWAELRDPSGNHFGIYSPPTG